jgi:hypothetical protein
VHRTQRGLRSELKPRDDFVLCGSGSSGSVVATLDLSTDLEAGRADLMVSGNVDGLPDICRITATQLRPIKQTAGRQPRPHREGADLYPIAAASWPGAAVGGFRS